MQWRALSLVAMVAVLGACGGQTATDSGSSGKGGAGGSAAKGGGTGGTAGTGTGTGGKATGTGGTGIGAGGTGIGTGGTGGTSGTCEALSAEYAARLADAKRCSRFPGPDRCSVEVGSDLICFCPVRVDAQNHLPIGELAVIEEKWHALHCDRPCAGDCRVPSGATCGYGGQGFECASTY